MSNIQVLESHVADLIAAGEVVERPASVAKELMENAIDAGATKITVEISHGGLTFLRVTDDGGGISAGDLPTAFLRHATSKLRTSRDLEAIGTLGFRGEALAAIAAVSRVQILSRPAGQELGASLTLEGGIPGPVEPAGCPLGTTIVVRDLFYNTPARLKFMKKDTAEGAAVFAVVQRLALSHPEVGVTFLRDGRQDLSTPGTGKLQDTIYAVLGRDLALGFVPVQGTGEGMTVSGFVSLPTCCRGSRSYQHFFVNGRYVKSPAMMAALEQAYQNQKMVGKFPGCVLCLTLPFSAVDVNVHPAKTEVKFHKEREVFSTIYHTVLSALDRGHARPMAPMGETKEFIPSLKEKAAATAAPSQRLEVNSFSHVALRGRPASPSGGGQVSRPARKKEAVVPEEAPKQEKVTLPQGDAVQELPSVQKQHFAPVKPAPSSSVKPEESAAVGEAQTMAQPELESQSWRLAGELFHTYLMVEQGDHVIFIDKHAAHERLNFDRMKAEDYTPMAQTLLAPLTLRFSAEEGQALLDQLPLLTQFGFEIEDFGNALLVRQAPFDVAVGEIEATLSEIAQGLLATGNADPTAARDHVLHTMACKAAIKGGWDSGREELEVLAKAVLSGRVRYCPHGRPVAIEMTKGQIEKQLKRT